MTLSFAFAFMVVLGWVCPRLPDSAGVPFGLAFMTWLDSTALMGDCPKPQATRSHVTGGVWRGVAHLDRRELAGQAGQEREQIGSRSCLTSFTLMRYLVPVHWNLV